MEEFDREQTSIYLILLIKTNNPTRQFEPPKKKSFLPSVYDKYLNSLS